MQNIKVFKKSLVKEKANNEILSQVLKTAIPVSLQSLVTSSFSLVDQMMIGNLGTAAIAGVAFAGKIGVMFNMLIGAVASTVAIMISQYHGKNDLLGLSKSFLINVYYALFTTVFFMVPALFFPKLIISFFTTDASIIPIAAGYLRIIAFTFIPIFVVSVASPIFRDIGYSKYLLYISLSSLAINTLLNYILIFGKIGFPAMGVQGAAIATLLSRILEMSCMFYLYIYVHKNRIFRLALLKRFSKKTFSTDFRKKTLSILLPMATSQLLWSLGEATYSAIYGRMSSESMAAMSIINPLQSITMALFSGFSTAAGIIVGNYLGNKKNEKAYKSSRQFLKYSVVFAVLVAMILLSISSLYPKLYSVPAHVASSSDNLIDVFAVFTAVKVCMSVVSMFLRSGGKTKYIAIVDFIGTFLIGIPIGFVAAFVWKLPIQSVYFLISIEELIRLIISLSIWRSKNWIRDITEEDSKEKVAVAA